MIPQDQCSHPKPHTGSPHSGDVECHDCGKIWKQDTEKGPGHMGHILDCEAEIGRKLGGGPAK